MKSGNTWSKWKSICSIESNGTAEYYVFNILLEFRVISSEFIIFYDWFSY